MADGDSPFWAVPASKWLAANDSAFVIADRFPVSPGHALVVLRRVIATWWEATDAERADILALVDEVKHQLDAALQPDGYNVGFNSGAAAGQTVEHLQGPVRTSPRGSPLTAGSHDRRAVRRQAAGAGQAGRDRPYLRPTSQ